VWIVRELVRLVERLVIGVSLAVVIAAVWALASSYSFAQGLHVTSLLLGALLILMGAMGRHSNFERAVDADVIRHTAWARFHAHRREDPTLRPGITLVLCGAALLAFGFFVAQ